MDLHFNKSEKINLVYTRKTSKDETGYALEDFDRCGLSACLFLFLFRCFPSVRAELCSRRRWADERGKWREVWRSSGEVRGKHHESGTSLNGARRDLLNFSPWANFGKAIVIFLGYPHLFWRCPHSEMGIDHEKPLMDRPIKWVAHCEFLC